MPALCVNKIQLSHFRSHKHSALQTEGRSVAIYGPNGAGKTNILEALSLMSPGRGLRRAKAEDIARRPDLIGWKVSVDMNLKGEDHEISTTWSGDGSRAVMVDDTASPQTALADIVRMAWLVPAMDRLWTEGADGRRRFLDRMTLSFYPDHGAKTIAYEKAMRERNRMLKDDVRDPSWYDAVEKQMAKFGAAIDANRQASLARIAKAQADAETEFPNALLRLVNADEADPIIEANDLRIALAASRPRDMHAGRSLVGPHRNDLLAIYAEKDMPAKECSTGEQKALLISLVLANGRALAQDFGAAPLVLLDEVAAHLDADRRASLYQEISQMGAQAWMTGTGADLFEAVGDDVVLVQVSDDEGASIIQSN